MEKTYEVVNIYRNYEPALTFTLALYGTELEYLRVSRSQSEELSQGLIFIGDFVKIEELTSDGIKIAPTDGVHNPAACEKTSLLLVESSERLKLLSDTRTTNFLPFLCDILPYTNTAVPETAAQPVLKNGKFAEKYLVDDVEVTSLRQAIPPSFVVRVCQKTRISMYPNTYNPFFFVIASSNGILIKIVFWREMLKKFSNLQVGDIIHIKDFKNKKKLPFIDKVECNTFTESVYFDCQEITARDLEKLKVENAIELDGYEGVSGRFECVAGRVEYLSVLLRYNCCSCLMEYILCRINNKAVVLFYNSDSVFYQIKEGNFIRVTELRRIKRAGVELYVSTIYTQFEVAERDEQSGKKFQVETKTPSVFGAVGYIPDTFESTAEILTFSFAEQVHGKSVSVGLFMKPAITVVDELLKEKLVLNELRKHVVHAEVLSVVANGLIVDYTEDGVSRKQVAARVSLEGGLVCYLFDNFFMGKRPSVDLDLLSGRVGTKQYIMVDAFRAGIDTVLYYITGLLEK